MNKKNNLLLHSCCAPCLTAVFETLSPENNVSIFWYNPNIEPEAEHQKRLDTLREYLAKVKCKTNLVYDYDYEAENKKWRRYVSGLESEPEGGLRCQKCFEFRITELIEKAGDNYSATTLTVSPYKNSEMINEIGKRIATEQNGKFLFSDFKKNGGYRRSIELSKKFDLYRQNYCGCLYSKRSII